MFSWWWTSQDGDTTVYDCDIENDNVYVINLDKNMITEVTQLNI